MMNRTSRYLSVVAFLCIAMFFSSPVAHAQADETSRSWNQPVKPFRIVGNLYYVGASDITSYLITTPQGHILLDSGFVETVPQIKNNVAQLGFRMEDVKILLNSHAHYDHAGGLALLKQMAGAKLYASVADAEALATSDKDNPHWGDRFYFDPVKADILLRDGDKVELGGVTMVARLTPGHTKGNTTWTMKVLEGGKTYNVVFAGSMSAPGFKLVDNAKHPNLVADYEHSFRLLKSLPCDIFLSSHASFFDMKRKLEQLSAGAKTNPFVDRQGYLNYIRWTEKSFKELVQKQRQAKAQGR